MRSAPEDAPDDPCQYTATNAARYCVRSTPLKNNNNNNNNNDINNNDNDDNNNNNKNNDNNNNNSEVLLAACIHRPDAAKYEYSKINYHHYSQIIIQFYA